MLVLLAVDLLVLAYYWVPTMLGHVGSESHEWTALGVTLVGVPVGIMLMGFLAILWYTSRRPPK